MLQRSPTTMSKFGILLITTLTFLITRTAAANRPLPPSFFDRVPCIEKPDPGPCDGFYPRWFYDAKKKKCKKFIWGGCEGNVPFETETECKEEKCADPCFQLPHTGPCRAIFIRAYFDQRTMTCKEFIWGGCQGSVPFLDVAECERKCGKDTPWAPTTTPLE